MLFDALARRCGERRPVLGARLVVESNNTGRRVRQERDGSRIIRQIAESEKYDIIFQEAAYANPRIDITDKVIKALDGKPPAK